jgi:hypothetical protein
MMQRVRRLTRPPEYRGRANESGRAEHGRFGISCKFFVINIDSNSQELLLTKTVCKLKLRV